MTDKKIEGMVKKFFEHQLNLPLWNERNILKNLLIHQFILNVKTNGLLWAHGYTNDFRYIDWAQAVEHEVVELKESGPCKHWANLDKWDYINYQVEFTDIVFFKLSQFIEIGVLAQDMREFSLSLWESNGGLKKNYHLVRDILDISSPEQLQACNERITQETIHHYLQWIDIVLDYVLNSTLIHSCSTVNNEYRASVAGILNGTIEETLQEKTATKLDKAKKVEEVLGVINNWCSEYNSPSIERFQFSLASARMFGLDFRGIHKMYCTKLALNIFRQENGYKDGTYRKQWKTENGFKEDNKVFFKAVSEAENISNETSEQMVKELLAIASNLYAVK